MRAVHHRNLTVTLNMDRKEAAILLSRGTDHWLIGCNWHSLVVTACTNPTIVKGMPFGWSADVCQSVMQATPVRDFGDCYVMSITNPINGCTYTVAIPTHDAPSTLAMDTNAFDALKRYATPGALASMLGR